MVYSIGLILIFLLWERTPLQSEGTRFLFSLLLYGGLIFQSIKAIKAILVPPETTIMAVEIESSTEKFNSGLSSAGEFINSSPDPGTSETLRRLTIADTSTRLHNADLSVALKAFSRKKSAFSMLFLLLLAVIWYGLSPTEFITGTNRLLIPLKAIAPYTSLNMEITPGHTIVARGTSIEISAKLSRKTPDPVLLNLFDPDKDDGTTVEMYPDANASDAKMVYNLTSLQESVDYQIKAEKFTSKRYSIKVMPRPEIEKLYLTLYQPSYIATEPVKLPEGIGEASLVKGSKVRIECIADQSLAKAEVLLIPGGTATCKLENDRSFVYEIEVATDTLYSIFLENEMGLRNEKPVQHKLKAVTDLPPTVEILKPGTDIPFPKSRRLDIKAVSRDDFGVKTMILYYRIGDRHALIPQNLKPDFRPMPDYEVEFPWMLDTLAIQPGTKVSYFIQAEDAKSPEPNIATTSTYLISMPSMYDMYHGEELSHENVTEKLKEFYEAQKNRRESLMEAYEQIKHEENLDYETRQALEKAIKEGEKQQRDAGQILESLENLQNSMEDNPFSSPEALERMQKVSELLNEVLDDETKQLMDQLRDSLQDLQIDPSELEKYREAFEMEEYMKGLDRTINLLEQVREQQKFNALGNAIEDLLKRQKHLASRTAELNQKMQNEGLSEEEESELKDMTDQQEKIGQELEQLQKQAEEMSSNRKTDEFEQNPLLEEVKNLRDRLQQNDHQKMTEEIKNQMQQKNLDSAQQEQKNMLKFLESLKQNAQQICNSCQGGSPPQLDLSSYILRTIQISKDQEKLVESIADFPVQFMRGQRPEIEGHIDQVSRLQMLVKQQASDLEYELENFIKSSFAIDPTTIDSIKGTQTIFSAIVKDLEDRALSQARSDQREITRRFNRLAIDLLRAQDQQSNSSGSSDPMNAMQQFKDLTRRQLSLYREMMKQQMSPGGKEMTQQLKKMAMEQRQIREALEKLMRESRQQMNTLGRLDDVIEDMEDIETQILDPDLRKKIAERQKKIYERMLKAQKAVKNRDEESEERQAKKAREIIQQKPDSPIGDIGTDSLDLSKDFLSDLKEEFPDDYKQLINDYYRSLNVYGDN
jgi:hypothetical protein